MAELARRGLNASDQTRRVTWQHKEEFEPNRMMGKSQEFLDTPHSLTCTQFNLSLKIQLFSVLRDNVSNFQANFQDGNRANV